MRLWGGEGQELSPFLKLLSDGLHLPALRSMMVEGPMVGERVLPSVLFLPALENTIAQGSVESLRELFKIMEDSQFYASDDFDISKFQDHLSTAVEEDKLPMACEMARLFLSLGHGDEIPPEDGSEICKYASQIEDFKDVAEGLAELGFAEEASQVESSSDVAEDLDEPDASGEFSTPPAKFPRTS